MRRVGYHLRRMPLWTAMILSAIPAATQGAMEIIWNHSHRDLSVKVIARQLGVNTRTLERRFRKTIGRTVLEELTSCRVGRAQLMLRNTHLPIKRIAYAAGFSSPTHLAVVFQRKIRQTPGQLRRGNASA